MEELPDMMSDLHQTTREFFAVKKMNGAVPEVWQGGSLDGLEYFRIYLDGVEFLLTDAGLFDQAEQVSQE